MTHDIRKLITNIRAWEAADKAYDVAEAEYAKSRSDDDYDAFHNAWILWRERAKTITPSAMDVVTARETLAAFVALADAYEAQAARIERALAIETAHPDTISGGLNNAPMAVGWNECRDEFRAALTGNDEGSA